MSLLNSIFPTAHASHAAAGAHQAAQGGWMSMMPMLIAFLLIFYFLMIRPQSKKAKAQREMLNSIAKGDEVVTAGGLFGKVFSLTDDAIELEIANNVVIKIKKASISSVLPKGSIAAQQSAA